MVDATGLHLIRVPGDRVVLRRGCTQLLLGGPAIAEIAERLVALLGPGRTREEVLDSFPGPLRQEVDRLLTIMTERRLVGEHAPPDAPDGQDDQVLQSSFFANFGSSAQDAGKEIASARVGVVGINMIARSLARSLIEMGIGELLLVGQPILDDEFAASGWTDELAAVAGDRVRILDTAGGEVGKELRGLGMSLLLATCDFGEADALVEASRMALREGVPFLPAWISDLVGYVGPLTYPFETACLRCYRLRVDSNTPGFDVARVVASETSTDPAGRASSGFLPPMAGVVGEITAMEAAKALAGFAPSDAVGRMIEINLVSFSSIVRRVLKVPRCPDCSETMAVPARALTEGPQIPFR